MEEKNAYTILVVDDDLISLEVAQAALSDTFRVIPVTSGKTAIEYLSRKNVDLILLDIAMPELDGYETLQIINEHKKVSYLPVIFLTAKDDSENKTKAFDLGAVDYIKKPFSVQVLKSRIFYHVRHHLDSDLDAKKAETEEEAYKVSDHTITENEERFKKLAIKHQALTIKAQKMSKIIANMMKYINDTNEGVEINDMEKAHVVLKRYQIEIDRQRKKIESLEKAVEEKNRVYTVCTRIENSLEKIKTMPMIREEENFRNSLASIENAIDTIKHIFPDTEKGT